ncbi:MAG: ABC transporter permease [Planctomycetaceae bacterium]|nr:ABC transporter permease [Planctomycetaceae bacterium]
MNDALTITRKDLRLLSRDRRALVILVALPMVIIAIVGSSTGRLRNDREQRRLGLNIEVADFDQTPTSKRLGGFLAAFENVRILPVPVSGSDLATRMAELQSSIPNGQSDARIVIGPTFESSLQQLSRSELTAPETGPLKDGLTAIDVHVSQNELADPLTEGLLKALLRLSLQDAMLPILAEKMPVFRGAARDSVIPEPWADSEAARRESKADIRVYQFLVPSYTVLFVFFLVNIMGRSFIAERDMGTLRRLKISPVKPGSILIGKTLPFLVMSLTQTTILMVTGKLLFGMSWGPSPWLLAPIMFCTSMSATMLGLLFSTICKTESQVSSFGNLIVLSSAGISGCLVPRAWMPPLSQKISLCTPHAWALDAYGELLTRESPDLARITLCCGVLLTFATVFFIGGLLRFRNDT